MTSQLVEKPILQSFTEKKNIGKLIYLRPIRSNLAAKHAGSHF